LAIPTIPSSTDTTLRMSQRAAPQLARLTQKFAVSVMTG